MPILCNIDGKKLSKRDFGFSLKDLQNTGFLPEAIVNYLAIIGGSYTQEIMSMEELIKTINFDAIHTTGQIKYDAEKLKWVNKKWVHKYELTDLVALCKPFLITAYSTSATVDDETLTMLIKTLQQDLTTLADIVPALHFYFAYQTPTKEDFLAHIEAVQFKEIAKSIIGHCDKIKDPVTFMNALKVDATAAQLPIKLFYCVLRIALTGQPTGPGIAELIAMLGVDEVRRRLQLLSDL
jgi:glutamyl/glutaminyl-tRNA synthetase